MPGRKKHSVRKGRGAMCNICGTNCGKGGALKKHIEGEHGINYKIYKSCFYNENRIIISEEWDDTGETTSGKTVMTHILICKIVGNPGKRGVAKKK
jgi:hypothetical protein